MRDASCDIKTFGYRWSAGQFRPSPVPRQSRQRIYSAGGFVFKGALYGWLASHGRLQMIAALSNSPKRQSR